MRHILLPSDRTPETYADAIRGYNKLVHNIARKELIQVLPELKSDYCPYAIVTTGSDGRDEKSYFSPLEIIVLHSEDSEIDTYLKKLKENTIHSTYFEEVSEVKDLQNDYSYHFNNSRDLVFPTRALDSQFIAGNKYLAEQYKLKLVEELKKPKLGKKVIKKFDNRRIEARQILDSGKQKFKQQEYIHFDENEGVFFYDGSMVKASKYGHLRAAQYKLAADIFKGIKNGIFPDDSFITTLPESTTERFNYLSYDDRLSISPNEVQDITSAYMRSLYWYHLAEENFLNRKLVELQIDRNEFKDVTNILRNFVNKKKSILK